MAGIAKMWPKIKRLSFIPINANGSTSNWLEMLKNSKYLDKGLM